MSKIILNQTKSGNKTRNKKHKRINMKMLAIVMPIVFIVTVVGVFTTVRGMINANQIVEKVEVAIKKDIEIQAKSKDFGEVMLVWPKSEKAKTYFVERLEKEASDQEWESLGETQACYWHDKTTQCGTEYEYRLLIAGEDKDQTEEYAKSKPIKTPENIVKLISVKASKSNFPVLEWEKVNYAHNYAIYRREAKKKKTFSKWKEIDTSDQTEYEDTSAKVKIKYEYKVTAYRTYEKIRYSGLDEKKFKSIILKKIKKKVIKKASKKKKKNSKKKTYVAKTRVSSAKAKKGYKILGNSGVTVDQMVRFYNKSGGKYPSDVYKDKGAATIEDFCKLLYEICDKNGVRCEVVFAQVCLETGYLKFPGDVDAAQCNFSGLGATGGVDGMKFKDVEEGLTCQIKHLKLYATTDPSKIKDDGSDGRYNRSLLGKAPYVEWLSIPNNPNTKWKDGKIVTGYGWAMSEKYAENMMSLINRIKAA